MADVASPYTYSNHPRHTKSSVYTASSGSSSTRRRTSPPRSPREQPRQKQRYSLQHPHSPRPRYHSTRPSYDEYPFPNNYSPTTSPSTIETASPSSSLSTTPSSTLSLVDQGFEADVEDMSFPAYDISDGEPDYTLSPSPSPADTEEPESPTSSQLSGPEVPLTPTQSVGDDIDIKQQPSRHVDYLSHEWKEEDIWSSWRHIVGRRGELENWQRLENASWRTWAKSKHSLKTVSPETLNWMKDHDVTWLYGPLQSSSEPSRKKAYKTSKSESKKTILKKRSLSEVMLQKSRSSSTLMKQAVDSVRAQTGDGRRGLTRGYSDYGDVSTPSHSRTWIEPPSALPSSVSSGCETPDTRKHISFNDKVEQCIAINEIDREAMLPAAEYPDSDSEEEGLHMYPLSRHTTRSSDTTVTARAGRPPFSPEQKTIAMLPSTTLRGDTPEPPPTQTRGRLTHSSSQETLRPASSTSRKSNFLIGDDDDEDMSLEWTPTSAPRRSRMTEDMPEHDEYEYETELAKGLRRTESGMLMPIDADGDPVSNGILGKVVDTVNTARDIAHVIWNVGWRK